MQQYAKLLRYDWGNVGKGGPLAGLPITPGRPVVVRRATSDSSEANTQRERGQVR